MVRIRVSHGHDPSVPGDKPIAVNKYITSYHDARSKKCQAMCVAVSVYLHLWPIQKHIEPMSICLSISLLYRSVEPCTPIIHSSVCLYADS